MKLTVKLEIHAYAEEKLCDEYFDDPPFFGINGPEIMLPLSKKEVVRLFLSTMNRHE